MMAFHISRKARDHYHLDENLFTSNGTVIIANFHAARQCAQKLNEGRDLSKFPEQAVRAGQINAMGILDEMLHLVASFYRQQQAPQVWELALDWLEDNLGVSALNATLRQFVNEFPPLAVYRGEISARNYLKGKTEGVPNRQLVLEELLMLWLANANPALATFSELFADRELAKKSAYPRLITALYDFFDTQPAFGPEAENLIDMLHSPASKAPNSLAEQLDFIRQRWGYLLGKHLFRLLSSMDLIREEEKPAFLGGGAGPAQVYVFRGQEAEPENFSPDLDWMPRVIMIAKNAFVWLDQLSKKYRQHLYRLDHIPDEELDTLARAGFSGLWLIGLWERSSASRTIKQMRGNPEAVASAYSLHDYQIASDLGGEEAFQNLHARAWQRGIRLASDMVPNHMGIDSRWVIEHPDWFISLDYSPFPSYSFNGPNVSTDQRVAIYIEDHYYTNTDAAVVFKRLDTWTGSARYIYHGNDGTSMPWNDTAQLNFLQAEAREAVIQTILAVARKFHIIRFDAAMTLTKRHFQRLWFPEPGTGGDIASRAEFGLSKEQFDQAMPVEFWREVVDRVAQEVPDTLLLAEAFWLMEGYFVRSLGMHRVYNSAFMNMLRDEKNAEYRLVIKNTIEFDPEILKRYVNFMNNPDERTAVDQFGSGDKYCGVCTMMITMPGLPMFGHGQIEGFTEKYGMEYRRAYWDEKPDAYLIERHQKEIFPLLRRRRLFAEVQNFLLYDFYTPEGYVNEDVFAYSNRLGEERSLVIYHNKFATARGWIKTSAAYSIKAEEASQRKLERRDLSEGLALEDKPDYFTIFRDQVSGLEYIHNNQEIHEKGLYFELDAYKYRALLDFRQIKDNELRHYARLSKQLQGRGVPDVEEALKELLLQPVLEPFRELVNAGMLRWLVTNRSHPNKIESSSLPAALSEAEVKTGRFLAQAFRLARGEQAVMEMGAEEPDRLLQGKLLHSIGSEIQAKVTAALVLPVVKRRYDLPVTSEIQAVLRFLGLEDSEQNLHSREARGFWEGDLRIWSVLLGWIFMHLVGKLNQPAGNEEASRTWIDEWRLGKAFTRGLSDLALSAEEAQHLNSLLKVLTTHHDWHQKYQWMQSGRTKKLPALGAFLQDLLNDPEVLRVIKINRYQDVLWFNQEAFESLLWWLLEVAAVDLGAALETKTLSLESYIDRLALCYTAIAALGAAGIASGFQVERLVEESKTNH